MNTVSEKKQYSAFPLQGTSVPDWLFLGVDFLGREKDREKDKKKTNKRNTEPFSGKHQTRWPPTPEFPRGESSSLARGILGFLSTGDRASGPTMRANSRGARRPFFN